MDWENARREQERREREAAARQQLADAARAAAEAERDRAERALGEAVLRVGAFLTGYVTDAERHGVKTLVATPPGEVARIDEVYFTTVGGTLQLRVPPRVDASGARVDDHAFITLEADAADPEALRATWYALSAQRPGGAAWRAALEAAQRAQTAPERGGDDWDEETFSPVAYRTEVLDQARFDALMNTLRFAPAVALAERTPPAPRRWSVPRISVVSFVFGAALAVAALLRDGPAPERPPAPRSATAAAVAAFGRSDGDPPLVDGTGPAPARTTAKRPQVPVFDPAPLDAGGLARDESLADE